MWKTAVFLAALPTLSVSLAAQTISFTPFAAQDQSLSTRPLLLGASLGVSVGPIGLRGSGSVSHTNWQPVDSTSPVADRKIQAFAGDVDLVLNAPRRAGAAGTFGALEPRLFAGYGVRGEPVAGGGTATHTVVSVGSVLSYSLLSRLRFDVEARRVAPASSARDLVDANRGGWEYRAGLSLFFGRSHLRPRRGVLPSLPVPTGNRTATSGAVDRGGTRVVAPAAGTLLATADRHIGTPYVWGGSTPQGFDCSGFVQYVYSKHGVPLPRTSREMALAGKTLGKDMSVLQPGDLMFFAENGRISHVAIYAGNDMIVHSSKSGGGVGYDDLTTPRGRWYRGVYAGGVRVLGVPLQSVTLAGGPRGGTQVESQRRGARSLAGAQGAGIAAFLKAAGMRDLSDAAKRLYAADEIPDGPDGAPKRRW